jgi:hypothetical protein
MLAFTGEAAVSIIIGVGTVLGGVGYAVGQFMSSRRKGLQESLAVAVSEITVLNGKLQRMETEMHRQADEVALLKAENVTLRSVISGNGGFEQMIDEKKAELEAFARNEHEKTRALIREILRG